jgi:hypothetical protein
MKFVALALALMLALALAKGYPLQGSNGAVNCTVFGAFKNQFNPGDLNAGKNAIFDLDVGLARANATDNSPMKATYTLIDGNDKAYGTREDLCKSLQPGRWVLGFVVPKEAVAKSLIVDPSKPEDGEQFIIQFEPLINASNGKAALLYYGILSTKNEPNRRSVEFDIGIYNNDTSRLSVSWKNFSLIDQWGWRYDSKAYSRYDGEGLPTLELLPNQTVRSGLWFNYLSPLSRPVKLAYSYNNSSALIIDIDPESGLRSSPLADCVSGEGSGQSQPEADPATLAGSIKASKARLAKVRENLNETA